VIVEAFPVLERCFGLGEVDKVVQGANMILPRREAETWRDQCACGVTATPTRNLPVPG
jgi:hypothetical protein